MKAILEDYLCANLFLILLVLFFAGNAQANNIEQNSLNCSIVSESEPLIKNDFRFSFQSDNQYCENNNAEWTLGEKAIISDDQYTSIELNGSSSSMCLVLDNFNFNIPYGSEILGIKVEIEGHAEGTEFISTKKIQLIDDEGNFTGQNKAGAPSVGSEWTPEDTNWKYGHANDTWNQNWTFDQINNNNFGVVVQISNETDQETIKAFIDQVKIIITYKPLFTICTEHDCFAMYIDSDNPSQSYQWIIPEEFEFRSESSTESIVNIGIAGVEYGNYSICIEIYENGNLIDECCREMIIDNCNPGALGNFVWQDVNADGVQNTGEIGMPGVKVSLLDIKLNEIASTVTDNLGYYSFQGVEEGAYILSFSEPNGFFFSPNSEDASDIENSDVSHAFGTGTTDIINLFAEDNAFNVDAGVIEGGLIGDKVWEDINGNGTMDPDEPGISDIVVILFDIDDIIIAQTITDENGNYEFPNLLSGSYYIKIVIPSGFEVTGQHQGNSSIDNDFDKFGESSTIELIIGEKIYNVDAGIYKLSKIGDFVWNDENKNGIQDANESGLADIPVFLMRSNGSVAKEEMTTKEGNYLFNNIIPGTYYLFFDAPSEFKASSFLAGSPQLDSDISNVNGTNTTENFKITSGTTNYDLDAGFYPTLSDISGITWIDENYNGQYESGEELLSGISIQLYNSADILIGESISDSDGYYSFMDVEPGLYYIKFGDRENFEFTLAEQGDEAIDSDANGVNGPGTTNTFELFAGQGLSNISSGYVGFAKIGDRVWLDDNQNGIQDEGEEGINGVLAQIFTGNGDKIGETISDSHPESGEAGYYIFNDLLPGQYYLLFETNLEFTEAFSGQNLDIDSDISNDFGFGTTSIYSLSSSEELLSVDAGFLESKGSISGLCWEDKNRDGIRTNDELVLNNIGVQLFDKDGSFIGSTETDTNGEYNFLDLSAGIYFVVFQLAESFDFTNPYIGSNTNDNNVTGSIVEGSTDLIEVNNGDQINNIDAGYVQGFSKIGDRVWIDGNSNGLQDENESGAPNIKVFLFDATASLVGSQITDENGFYEFTDVPPGNYFLLFNPDANFIITKSKIGSDDNIDSDVTNALANGTTDVFTVNAGIDIDYLDAGIFELASLGDFVWLDTNLDGLQQDSEEGINGLTLGLYDELGNFIISTQSKNNPNGGKPGFYEFSQISPGEYKILIELPPGFDFTTSFAGNENLDSDIANVVDDVGATQLIFLSSGELNYNIDIGFFEPVVGTASIGDFVWHDNNSDGIQNEEEKGINNIEIILFNESGVELENTITSNHPDSGKPGYYQFSNLISDAYYLVLNLSSGLTLTGKELGSNSELDSDFSFENGQFVSSVFDLQDGEIRNDLDAGIVFEFARIGDYVWADANQDGVQDANEIGVNEIEVSLYTETGEFVKSTTTANNATDIPGYYLFDEIVPGAYYLKFTSEEEYPFTAVDLGGNDTKDSDVTNSNGIGSTNIFGIGSGETDLDLDAGLIIPGRTVEQPNEYQNSKESVFQAFPNPVYNYIDIKLESNYTGKANIEIFDLSGKPVLNIPINLQKEKSKSTRVNLSDCAPGLYFIRIKLKDQILTRIITKQDL